MKVMFVDDEPNILSGLRRMMRSKRDEWDQTYVNGGAEALSAIEEQGRFDVIVTDMRMPQMDGAELLRKVYEKYPETIRIILSGHSEKEMVMRSLGFAHQYLTKPSSAEEICSTIRRSVQLRTMLKDERLHKQVANVRSLPTPPEVYKELMDAMQDEDASAANVTRIISKDVALTAKMLQILNSAFFGLPTRVTDILHAVNLLGLETVRSIVISTSVFNSFAVRSVGTITTNNLSSHCIRVGALARSVATQLDLPVRVREDALLAGMLHDVGKLIQLTSLRKELKEIVMLSKRKKISHREAELEIMGVGHCELGAHLMTIWGLPDPIVEAVAFHHQPGEAGMVEPEALLPVHIADALIAGARTRGERNNTLDETFVAAMGLGDKVGNLTVEALEPAGSK